MWDNFGPNAVSNAIVKEADALALSGRINLAVRTSPYGSDEFLYWATTEAATQALEKLQPGERQILLDIVKSFGHLSVRRIVAESKKTKPFQVAQQYQVLQLQESPNRVEFQQRLSQDPDFVNAVRASAEEFDPGDLISQEEMDRLYADRHG